MRLQLLPQRPRPLLHLHLRLPLLPFYLTVQKFEIHPKSKNSVGYPIANSTMTAAAIEDIPTSFASLLYKDGCQVGTGLNTHTDVSVETRDAMAKSHLYTKMQWLDATDHYAVFPVPSGAPGANVFWLQLRITSTTKSVKPLSVDLRYSPTESADGAYNYLPSPVAGASPIHYVATPLQVENRKWSLLTWAIPAAPMIDQQLEICVSLPDRTPESRPEFLRLDLLGFKDLYPASKEYALGADKKGHTIVGYYNSLRPNDCVFLPLSGHIMSEGLTVLRPLASYLDGWNEEGGLRVGNDGVVISVT